MYRVLYASSQRIGCFLETLGRFRVDPKLLAELAQIEGEDDYSPLGEVPLEWVEKANRVSSNRQRRLYRYLYQRVDQPIAGYPGRSPGAVRLG
jgi:hypothetical protein